MVESEMKQPEAEPVSLFDTIIVPTMYDDIVSRLLKSTLPSQHIVIVIHAIDDEREMIHPCNESWLSSVEQHRVERITFITLAPHVQSRSMARIVVCRKICARVAV